MALPFILSLLGSGLAGAGTLAMSPLIAGAVGAGVGTAIQEKDLGAGIRSGLTAGLLGGLGGALLGGGGAAAAQGAADPTGVLGSGATGIKEALAAMPAGTSAVAAPSL